MCQHYFHAVAIILLFFFLSIVAKSNPMNVLSVHALELLAYYLTPARSSKKHSPLDNSQV